MRLAGTQPCSQQAWASSPKLQGDHRQERGADLVIAHRINSNDSVALAVPPSQWTAMPRSSCNGQIYISAGVHSLKMKPHPIPASLIFRRKFLSKKDMNFLGWEGGGCGKQPNNQTKIPLFGQPQGLCNRPRVLSAGLFQGALSQLHLVAKRTFRLLLWASAWAPRGQGFGFRCCHFA